MKRFYNVLYLNDKGLTRTIVLKAGTAQEAVDKVRERYKVLTIITVSIPTYNWR